MNTKINRPKISASSNKKTMTKFKAIGKISNGKPQEAKRKAWRNFKSIAEDVIALHGCIALTDQRFGYLSRGNQGSAACSIAPAYAKQYSICHWSAEDLDRIAVIADKLYRTTLQKQKAKNGSHVKPNCLFPSFYIDLTKITNFIGGEVFATVVDGNNGNVLEIQLNKFLETNDAAILNSGEKYYSFWKTDDNWVCYCPYYREECEKLTIFKKEHPCLIKSNHLHGILQFIKAMLSTAHFALYSLKIMRASEVCRTYSHFFFTQQNASPEEPPISTESMQSDPAKPQTFAIFQDTDLPLPSFSSDFSKFDDTRGSLTCNSYVKDPSKVPCTIVASLVFLQDIKPYLWTRDTLMDIIVLANSIFEKRSANYVADNWESMQDIQIPFANKTLKMKGEKVVCGTVTCFDNEGYDFGTALEYFLKNHSFGLVQGPQSVAVWQEGHIYFMFDAKERDRLGRKWTKLNSSSLGDEKPYGSACLTWFKSLKDLAELYISNIPPKQRNDSFSILQVNFMTLEKVPQDWNAWQPIEDAWILCGSDSVCNYTSTISQRISHGLCATVIACIYPNIRPEAMWTSDTINELISSGFELYKTCLESRNLDDPLLFQIMSISNMGRHAELEGRKIEFTINEYAVAGFILPTSDEKLGLLSGLNNLFTKNTAGILAMRNEYLAVWKSDGVYYAMDPFARNKRGISASGCHNAIKLGGACAMRFRGLDYMANLISGNMVPTRSCEYHIASVACTGADLTGKPLLKSYEKFTSDGAILRTYNNLHEGHSMFGSTADKQTLCNLLTALGFSHIYKAAGWTKEDVIDILRNGDRMCCGMLNGLQECESTNFKISWEVLGDHFQFGGHNFYYSRAEQNGVIFGSLSADEEYFEKDTQIKETTTKPGENEVFDKTAESHGTNSKKNIEISDLTSILSEWKEQESVRGILQSNLFDISIWKENGLYFVFDPKASDYDGALTSRRLFIASKKIVNKNLQISEENKENVKEFVLGEADEESLPQGTPDTKEGQKTALEGWSEEIERNVALAKQIREQNNEGTAYVAWFLHFESFIEHILSKVPKEHISEEFTLNTIKIKCGPTNGNENRDAFRTVVSDSHWIMRATISQNDSQFFNRGKQDAGNCAMSLAFALMCPPDKYSPTLLDITLKYGDRLYTKSVEKLWNKGDTKVTNGVDNLELTDLIKSFSVYKHRFNFHIKRKYSGVLNRADNINLPSEDFHEAISGLGAIANNEGGIMNYGNYYVTIWKTVDYVFMFDPHPTSSHGNKSESGVASLSRVTDIDSLFTAFLGKFECTPGLKLFELYTIEVTKYMPEKVLEEYSLSSDFPAARPELSTFDKICKGVRLLRTVLQSRVVSQVHTSLAALVFNEIVSVEYWTDFILTQIAYLGVRLYMKSSVTQRDSGVENCSSWTEAMNRNFTVNSLSFHVDFGDAICGPITCTADAEVTNLGQSLTLLMKSASKVILKIKNIVMSIWVENGIFYAFYVNPVSKECNVVSADKLELLCNWLEKNAKDAGVQNLYEIKTIYLHKIIKQSRCRANIPWQSESTLNNEYTKRKIMPRLPEMDAGKIRVQRKASEYLRASIPNEQREMASSSLFSQGLKGACLVAAGMAHVKHINEWNSKTLDAIMESGMVLYVKSLAAKQADQLEITDLEQNLHISNVRVQAIALLSTHEKPFRENILPIIKYALEDYKCVYVCTPHKCFTIMKQNYKIYLFDPNLSVYCPRLEKWSYVASLLQFEDVSFVADHVSREVKNKSESVDIGPIIICVRN